MRQKWKQGKAMKKKAQRKRRWSRDRNLLFPLRAQRTMIGRVLHEFSFLHKRRPDPSRSEEDEIELLTIKNSLLDKLSVPQENSQRFCEVSPICAVVGGVLGQEIIKAVSGKDAPLNNFFFFSPDDGAGVVENLGY
ncbi:SUMO-activating enzyme subunit 1 [Armadillidium vulgare]|nr:SUMO-activating enzyme subunit 1 [Armadillidium vulgare]